MMCTLSSTKCDPVQQGWSWQRPGNLWCENKPSSAKQMKGLLHTDTSNTHWRFPVHLTSLSTNRHTHKWRETHTNTQSHAFGTRYLSDMWFLSLWRWEFYFAPSLCGCFPPAQVIHNILLFSQLTIQWQQRSPWSSRLREAQTKTLLILALKSSLGLGNI